MTQFVRILTLAIGMLTLPHARAAGTYVKLDYPASTASNELQVAVTYTLWIPDGLKTLRGIIVHQHGRDGDHDHEATSPDRLDGIWPQYPGAGPGRVLGVAFFMSWSDTPQADDAKIRAARPGRDEKCAAHHHPHRRKGP